MKKRLAVLFPGIGYTNDRSLLYFSGRLAEKEGYELLRISYGGFPSGVKGDKEKMHQVFLSAKEQALEQLQAIVWKDYEEVLFIAKSIGTVVASAIAEEKGIDVRSIVFTPIAETFLYLKKEAIVFHGTKDPWAKTAEIREACSGDGITLHITEQANHSLETGDVLKDIENLRVVLREVRTFLRDGSW